MGDEAEKERLRKFLEEDLREHGVSFEPQIRASPARTAYLEFLGNRGQTEADVLPMMDLSQVTEEVYRQSYTLLQRELDRTRGKLSPEFGTFLANSVRMVSNTNSLIDTISMKIEELLEEFGIDAPPFYAGVFPTANYNGEARDFDGHNLILLHTGLIETIEFAVLTLIANLNKEQKTNYIRQAVQALAKDDCIPSDQCIPTDGIKWGDLPAAVLTNGADAFILLHEIGHVMLGHVAQAPSTRGKKLSDQERKQAWENEYAADKWAFDVLHRVGRKIRDRVDPEMAQLAGLLSGLMGGIGSRVVRDLELFGCLKSPKAEKDSLEWISGPVIALGVGALVEEAYSDKIDFSNSDHPPAMARLENLYKENWENSTLVVAPAAKEFLSIVKDNIPYNRAKGLSGSNRFTWLSLLRRMTWSERR